ncbi:MAG: hypothetical protein IPL79_17985 [Myxococcales bacterium]|nr:hypothetical protein [Myxococcales bacterium]
MPQRLGNPSEGQAVSPQPHKPGGLGEAVARLQTRSIDFEGKEVAPSSLSLKERLLRRAQTTIGKGLLSMRGKPRRLSAAKLTATQQVYDKVAAVATAHGATKLGDFEVFGSSMLLPSAFASHYDGAEGVFIAEKMIIDIERFLRQDMGVTDERLADELGGAVMATIIGHELTHQWRRDALRVKPSRLNGVGWRGKEVAADLVGARLADRAGFRPEGVYLTYLYLATKSAQVSGRRGERGSHPADMARMERSHKFMTAALARRGEKPLLALPTPDAAAADFLKRR